MAVAASVTTQASVFALYEVTRPIPDPRLSLHFSGEGTGQILVTKVGDPAPLLRCSNVDPTIEELGYVDNATDASTVEVVSYVVDLIRRRKPKQRCELDLEPGTRVRLTAVLGRLASRQKAAMNRRTPKGSRLESPHEENRP